MEPPPASRSVRIASGEIESRLVSTRLVIPSSAQPAWPPFRRLGESIASRGRQLPAHAHAAEEVLTYVIEGFASYQLDAGPSVPLSQGSARLLTALSRVNHRVVPAEGAAIRWFNLVVGLPQASVGGPQLQAAGPGVPPVEVDNVRVVRLVGPEAPMRSSAGLECADLLFVQESTTFATLGGGRRAIVYALAGHGSVDQRDLSSGEAALAEGLPAVAIRGAPGFRAILATAPRELRSDR